MLASLDGALLLVLADGAFETQHNFLGGLCLLVEDGLGLSSVPVLEQTHPDCLRSYLRFPCAKSDAFPVLYCVTLCAVCLRHVLPLQKVLRVFGMLTIEKGDLGGFRFNRNGGVGLVVGLG